MHLSYTQLEQPLLTTHRVLLEMKVYTPELMILCSELSTLPWLPRRLIVVEDSPLKMILQRYSQTVSIQCIPIMEVLQWAYAGRSDCLFSVLCNGYGRDDSFLDNWPLGKSFGITWVTRTVQNHFGRHPSKPYDGIHWRNTSVHNMRPSLINCETHWSARLVKFQDIMLVLQDDTADW
jgi:hypothetical protein